MGSHRTALVTALLAAGALASCNTMQGLGEDMREGGIALSHAARQAQDNGSEPAPPVEAPAARISMDRARSLALAARPGEISDGELGRGPDGGLRYTFTVHSRDGAFAVGIDAENGAVLENRLVQVGPS